MDWASEDVYYSEKHCTLEVTCRIGFEKCDLRFPQAVGLYCSCHAAQASKGNFLKQVDRDLVTPCLIEQDFVALEVHLHPYYRFTPQADRYDVAVIRLDRRVAFEPHISPICLPEKLEAVPEGTVAMVAGWGATDPSSKERPVDLQAADVNVVNSTLCESWHRKNELKVSSR